MKKVNIPRTLSPEERYLWDKVKKTAQPLERASVTLDDYLSGAESSSALVPKAADPGSKSKVGKTKGVTVKPYSPEPKNQPVLLQNLGNSSVNKMEKNTARKIAKGRISIEGRIDLHGLTQLEAHGRLFRYLEEAWFREKRTVLVITGKGKGEGILRQAVPRWLSEPSFRAMISGVSEANSNHGGEGAIYVRLKRRNRP